MKEAGSIELADKTEVEVISGNDTNSKSTDATMTADDSRPNWIMTLFCCRCNEWKDKFNIFPDYIHLMADRNMQYGNWFLMFYIFMFVAIIFALTVVLFANFLMALIFEIYLTFYGGTSRDTADNNDATNVFFLIMCIWMFYFSWSIFIFLLKDEFDFVKQTVNSQFDIPSYLEEWNFVRYIPCWPGSPGTTIGNTLRCGFVVVHLFLVVVVFYAYPKDDIVDGAIIHDKNMEMWFWSVFFWTGIFWVGIVMFIWVVTTLVLKVYLFSQNGQWRDPQNYIRPWFRWLYAEDWQYNPYVRKSWQVADWIVISIKLILVPILTAVAFGISHKDTVSAASIILPLIFPILATILNALKAWENAERMSYQLIKQNNGTFDQEEAWSKIHDNGLGGCAWIFALLFCMIVAACGDAMAYSRTDIKRELSYTGWHDVCRVPNVIDASFLAVMSYTPDEYRGNIPQWYEQFLNNDTDWEWVVEGAGAEGAVEGSYFFHISNEMKGDRKWHIIVVRGTSSIGDMIQDAKIWAEAAMLQLLSFGFPVVYILPTPVINTFVDFSANFQSWISRTDSNFLIDEIEEYVVANVGDNDHLWVVGHSLGGGAAQIIATRIKDRDLARGAAQARTVRGIGFAPVGAMFSAKKLGISRHTYGNVATSIYTDRDIVPWLDKHAGTEYSLHANMVGTVIDAHSIEGLMCEIYRHCGVEDTYNEDMMRCMCCNANFEQRAQDKYAKGMDELMKKCGLFHPIGMMWSRECEYVNDDSGADYVPFGNIG